MTFKCSINLLFRYGAKRSHLIPYACIGKDNVNAPLLLCNLRVEPVKVFQVGNIPLDGRDVLSNFRNGSSFTCDLYALAEWLECSRIPAVAMESTGVYWIPLFQILEERGFKVYLVNAHSLKTVPGPQE